MSEQQNNDNNQSTFTIPIGAFQTKLELNPPSIDYDNAPDVDDIKEGFSEIDFENTALTELTDGDVVFLQAVKVIKTKYKDVLYGMDYNGKCWKLNNSTLERLKQFKIPELRKLKNIEYISRGKVLLSKTEPLLCLVAVKNAEYQGYAYKKYQYAFTHSQLRPLNIVIDAINEKKQKKADDNW